MLSLNNFSIFLGIVLIKEDRILLFQRKEQGDWILPGSLVPSVEDFDEIPYFIKLCGLVIERTEILGVHKIGDQQYMVTITGKMKDSSLTLTEHYSKAEWANISELIKYPIKPGQRFCIEYALSTYFDN